MGVIRTIRRLLRIALVAPILIAAEALSAADYPQKPVMVITPTGAGSGPDAIARIVFDRLSHAWGRQVMVVNRPGGGGTVALQALSTAERDGHTLFLAIASTLVVLPVTQAKLPLDLRRDLVPIGLLAEQPLVLAAHRSLEVASLSELVAVAKKRPGQITYGSNRGSLPHMTVELLQHRAGIELTFVPYPTSAKAAQDGMGGIVSLFVESLGTVAAGLERASVRALAVGSSTRLPNFSDIPTINETLPSFEAKGWFGLMALAGTPGSIVAQISHDLRSVLEQKELQQRLQTLGAYARAMSPGETAEFIRKEQELWGPIVAKLGVSNK